ncbi:Endoglucanase 20 [Acorus calamus]|uniref:cellulase n=1 Tax=Acorus calamus TaxID=4465 RepID=A0AAV9FHC5_ACOCL|nr:Endoglucanase 20 [Acorus calamus]
MARFKRDADSFICSIMPVSGTTQVPTTPGGLLYTRDGANLHHASSASLILVTYSKTLSSARIHGVQCDSQYFFNEQIRAFAKKSQVDYILGKNPKGMSYMVELCTPPGSIDSLHESPSDEGGLQRGLLYLISVKFGGWKIWIMNGLELARFLSANHGRSKMHSIFNSKWEAALFGLKISRGDGINIFFYLLARLSFIAVDGYHRSPGKAHGVVAVQSKRKGQKERESEDGPFFTFGGVGRIDRVDDEIDI